MAKKTYTPMPSIRDEMARRYQVTLGVLSGALTVSEAARQLGMARNTFQSLMHRGLTAMVSELGPKLPGRPARPEVEKKLLEQNEQLSRDNRDLREELQTMHRLIGVASELIRDRGSLRRKRTKKTKTTAPPETPDEDLPERRLARVRQVRAMGVKAAVAAALSGLSAATLRRWEARDRCGVALVGHSTKPAAVEPHTEALVEDRVRSLRGLVGADALRHSVAGVSRRRCAAIKAETLSAVERERQSATAHVVVTAAGVVRGFDQLWVHTTVGRRLLLLAGDAAVPFRTSASAAEHYDGPSVRRALERDLELGGAPLVYRLDRARSHDVPEVRELLAAHKVLVLHGPPRCPTFYGQTERQNREHRAWVDSFELPAPSELETRAERMLDALNGLWPRRTLGWRTASEVWCEREAVTVDRDELREEVTDRAGRIRRDTNVRGAPADLAERLAIEAALTQRGLLRREAGAWC